MRINVHPLDQALGNLIDQFKDELVNWNENDTIDLISVIAGESKPSKDIEQLAKSIMVIMNNVMALGEVDYEEKKREKKIAELNEQTKQKAQQVNQD